MMCTRWFFILFTGQSKDGVHAQTYIVSVQLYHTCTLHADIHGVLMTSLHVASRKFRGETMRRLKTGNPPCADLIDHPVGCARGCIVYTA